jgi:hypothetical protein
MLTDGVMELSANFWAHYEGTARKIARWSIKPIPRIVTHAKPILEFHAHIQTHRVDRVII